MTMTMILVSILVTVGILFCSTNASPVSNQVTRQPFSLTKALELVKDLYYTTGDAFKTANDGLQIPVDTYDTAGTIALAPYRTAKKIVNTVGQDIQITGNFVAKTSKNIVNTVGQDIQITGNFVAKTSNKIINTTANVALLPYRATKEATNWLLNMI